MARKSKSVKKRFYGVNANELALVFSIAITLFVTGVITGGLKLNSQSKNVSAARVVNGTAAICGRCISYGSLKNQAEYKCAPGTACIGSYEGGEFVTRCRCQAKDKNGQYTNEACKKLASGSDVVVPGVSGVPGFPDTGDQLIKAADSCWKIPKAFGQR